MKAEDDDQSLVAVAQGLRTRGLKGEIVAELLTDFPERFDGLTELVAVTADAERRVVTLEDHWFQKDRVVLKFVGYDDPESAATLVGCEFAVPEAERVELPEGYYYDWELEGCEVALPSGAKIGRVVSVLKTGATPVLVLENTSGSEILIPLAESVVTDIDRSIKLISIDPPDGLLDL